MKENDIKNRMIRQSIPETAMWADTTYQQDPKAIEGVLKRLEVEQLGRLKTKTPIEH